MNPQSREEFQRQKRIRMRLARASFRIEMAELEGYSCPSLRKGKISIEKLHHLSANH